MILRCPNCNSGWTEYRIRKARMHCRKCGNEWEIKSWVEKRKELERERIKWLIRN